MKYQKIVLTFTLVILVSAVSSAGLAAPRIVTLWTFNPNCEWIFDKQKINKKFGINLNIQIVHEPLFLQQLQTAIKDQKDFPDIIEWRIENNQVMYSNPYKSYLAPLEKYAKKSKIFSQVIPGRVSWVTYGGHIYGLPKEAHPAVLIYNDTLWKAAGVDVATLETWDEFMTAAQKLAVKKREDGRPVHYALPENGGLDGTMFMIWQQSGAQFLDNNGRPCFTSPAFQTFVEKWLEWYRTGIMYPWDWSNFGPLLDNGTYCSYISPDWWVSQVNSLSNNGEYQFRVRPLPLYAKGGPRTASWGGTFMGIVKLAKNQDQLYKIIEYMLYDEYQTKIRGRLSPYTGAWNDPVFHQPDERFGGQKLGEIQTSVAREMPSIQCGDIFWEAIQDFNAVYPEMISGAISVADGLKKVQEKALERYRQLE